MDQHRLAIRALRGDRHRLAVAANSPFPAARRVLLFQIVATLPHMADPTPNPGAADSGLGAGRRDISKSKEYRDAHDRSISWPNSLPGRTNLGHSLTNPGADSGAGFYLEPSKPQHLTALLGQMLQQLIQLIKRRIFDPDLSTLAVTSRMQCDPCAQLRA